MQTLIGGQGPNTNMMDFDQFPSEEAVTRVGGNGDRPTPVFHAPPGLRYFDDVASVPPSPAAGNQLASQPSLSTVSMLPSEAEELVKEVEGESEFFDSAPRYSMTSMRPMSLAPALVAAPAPSRLRRYSVKFLFLVLFSGVLALLGYEASVVFGVSLEDVQLHATNLINR
jgi:hypothetical protein